MPRPGEHGGYWRGHTLFVVGNDGSGKTTFTNRIARKAEALGLRVRRRRYYGSAVRTIFRRLIDAWTGASQKKTNPGTGDHDTNVPPRARRRRRLILLTFLWSYQTAIGLETRLRDLLDRSDLQIVDRSFVDDLVSIGETLGVEIPASLLRYSCVLFPVRRLYFLSAGDAVEFARIADLDLTEAFHHAKGKRYREMVTRLEPWAPGLRRISTAPKHRSS